MSVKRALVVDDSKSARAFLSRLLEKHLLEVDTAESAEQAIDYLTRHRPDVIFMDHLMPGMDGFQAVQAIKNNPRTATIPILMYTSQEGELYLGQARALGAIGVLPKQIRPADVSQVLHQLKLLDDRRVASVPVAEDRRGATGAHTLVSLAELDGEAETQIAASPLDPGATTAQVQQIAAAALQPLAAPAPRPAQAVEGLREEMASLRRLLVTSLDQQTERLLEDVRVMIRDVRPPAPEPPAPIVVPDSAATRFWAVAATLAALLLCGLWQREVGLREALQNRAQQATAATAAPAGDAQPTGVDAASPARQAAAQPARSATPPGVILTVPYGEAPLAGARVEQVRGAIADFLRTAGAGSIEVQAFPGRFCLMGNSTEGYSLAPGDVPMSQCELLGNPLQDNASIAQRESLPFANMIAELRKGSAADPIRVTAGTAEQTLKPYPETGGTPVRVPNAAEWNAAAAANNRVEIRWRTRQ